MSIDQSLHGQTLPSPSVHGRRYHRDIHLPGNPGIPSSSRFQLTVTEQSGIFRNSAVPIINEKRAVVWRSTPIVFVYVPLALYIHNNAVTKPVWETWSFLITAICLTTRSTVFEWYWQSDLPQFGMGRPSRHQNNSLLLKRRPA